MKKHQRSFVSLLTAFSFVVLAVTGILAFVQPFSIGAVGLHALLAISVGLTALFLWQPAPIRSILALSRNLGPATDQFRIKNDGLAYNYAPTPGYRIALTVRAGEIWDANVPPHIAIWLENASF